MVPRNHSRGAVWLRGLAKAGRPFEPDAGNAAEGRELSPAMPLSCAWPYFFHRLPPMIATKDSIEPHSSEQLPKSTRVYLEGSIHPDVRVPVREIELSPTKSYTGAVEQNEPVRVYD